MNISSCENIRAYPDEMRNLKKIKMLVANNVMGSLDNQPSDIVVITDLTSLEYLDLMGINITSLPEEFSNLKNLKILLLPTNELMDEAWKMTISTKVQLPEEWSLSNYGETLTIEEA